MQATKMDLVQSLNLLKNAKTDNEKMAAMLLVRKHITSHHCQLHEINYVLVFCVHTVNSYAKNYILLGI